MMQCRTEKDFKIFRIKSVLLYIQIYMDTEQTNQNKPLEKYPVSFSNNVVVGTTLSEIVLTFAIGNTPNSVIYLSLPVAKTLGNLINNSISDYEQKSGNKIFSLEELFERQNKTENEESVNNYE